VKIIYFLTTIMGFLCVMLENLVGITLGRPHLQWLLLLGPSACFVLVLFFGVLAVLFTDPLKEITPGDRREVSIRGTIWRSLYRVSAQNAGRIAGATKR